VGFWFQIAIQTVRRKPIDVDKPWPRRVVHVIGVWGTRQTVARYVIRIKGPLSPISGGGRSLCRFTRISGLYSWFGSSSKQSSSAGNTPNLPGYSPAIFYSPDVPYDSPVSPHIPGGWILLRTPPLPGAVTLLKWQSRRLCAPHLSHVSYALLPINSVMGATGSGKSTVRSLFLHRP
jgi:hypothetical protein